MCQEFLAETVESVPKTRCVIEATHVWRRKLRKDLELFGNVLVHGFYRLKALITLEQVNTTECGRIKTRMLISKTAMVSLRSWRYCVVVE